MSPPVNPFGHIDLRVRDLEKALPFYAVLMPELGFTRAFHGDRWKVYAAAGELPSAPFFGVNEDASHVANANRIAFWVESRARVDHFGALLQEMGATIESGPRDCPEYSASYYAVFFEDPSGNKLEVVFRTD